MFKSQTDLRQNMAIEIGFPIYIENGCILGTDLIMRNVRSIEICIQVPDAYYYAKTRQEFEKAFQHFQHDELTERYPQFYTRECNSFSSLC